MRARHDSGQLPVLSFGEGQGTSIGGVLPFMWVVPPEAAYPGYGEFELLASADHINTCKPHSRLDPSYVLTLQFLRGCAATAAEARRDKTEQQQAGEQIEMQYAG